LKEFVCVRLDWDQMQRHRTRWRVLTQGNQLLLDPGGRDIPGVDPRGKRYDIPELVGLLDRVLREYPHDPSRSDALKLTWFFWNPKERGLPGSFGAEAVGRLDRKPVLTVSGPIPAWLEEPSFLRRHLRQFIWTRGEPSGPSRITVRQMEPGPKQLASLSLEEIGPDKLADALDEAWLAYFRERPLVARGYIDNPHGRWLKSVMERVHQEELKVRQEALSGTLKPAGRP
jgi:hypothetical protein